MVAGKNNCLGSLSLSFHKGEKRKNNKVSRCLNPHVCAHLGGDRERCLELIWAFTACMLEADCKAALNSD